MFHDCVEDQFRLFLTGQINTKCSCPKLYQHKQLFFFKWLSIKPIFKITEKMLFFLQFAGYINYSWSLFGKLILDVCGNHFLILLCLHDRTDTSVYQRLFMENWNGSRGGNSAACAILFPSDTVISSRQPNSASIFTAEIWAFIKALEQIKKLCCIQIQVFTD